MDLPIIIADTPRRRLRGLLGYRIPPPHALLLDPCRSVHTFGMRFPLDLHWLGPDGDPVRTDHAVAPFRIRTCRHARAVIEVPTTPAAAP